MEEDNAMQTLNGIGRLYESGGKAVQASVSYQVFEKPAESGAAEWGGQIVVDKFIPLGEYGLQLEDGRGGRIKLTTLSSMSRSTGPVYNYPFRGISQLRGVTQGNLPLQ